MHFGLSLSVRGPLAKPDVLVTLADKAGALRFVRPKVSKAPR